MDIAQIEKPIVFVIVIVQLIVAVWTFLKIAHLKKFFPKAEDFKIVSVEIDGGKFVNKIECSRSNGSQFLRDKFAKVGLESVFDKAFPASNSFSEILESLNTYLERNSTAATDFNLIKDVVERNGDKLEEEINLTISIPLYLGLMGTMTGIVIGLFSMSDLQSAVTDTNLGAGITILLNGVKIAMIASLTGLGLTVINSGWFFRAAKTHVESRKNDFYTFIQTQLLPVVNQSLNATFDSLQRNLIVFNDQFSINLNKLGGIFDTNYEAIIALRDTLETVQNINLKEVSTYNVKVFKQLQLSMEEFEKFNQYLGSINMFVDKVNYLIKRTDNFENIAERVDQRLVVSQNLIEFIQSHFKALDERKKVIQTTVATVDNAISDALNELKTHTQNSIDKLKKFSVEEADALRSALSDARTNLSNLSYLENLKKDLSLMKDNSAIQGQKVKDGVENVNDNIEKLLEIMHEMNTRQKQNVFKRIYDKYAKTKLN